MPQDHVPGENAGAALTRLNEFNAGLRDRLPDTCTIAYRPVLDHEWVRSENPWIEGITAPPPDGFVTFDQYMSALVDELTESQAKACEAIGGRP